MSTIGASATISMTISSSDGTGAVDPAALGFSTLSVTIMYLFPSQLITDETGLWLIGPWTSAAVSVAPAGICISGSLFVLSLPKKNESLLPAAVSAVDAPLLVA